MPVEPCGPDLPVVAPPPGTSAGGGCGLVGSQLCDAGGNVIVAVYSIDCTSGAHVYEGFWSGTVFTAAPAPIPVGFGPCGGTSLEFELAGILCVLDATGATVALVVPEFQYDPVTGALIGITLIDVATGLPYVLNPGETLAKCQDGQRAWLPMCDLTPLGPVQFFRWFTFLTSGGPYPTQDSDFDGNAYVPSGVVSMGECDSACKVADCEALTDDTFLIVPSDAVTPFELTYLGGTLYGLNFTAATVLDASAANAAMTACRNAGPPISPNDGTLFALPSVTIGGFVLPELVASWSTVTGAYVAGQQWGFVVDIAQPAFFANGCANVAAGSVEAWIRALAGGGLPVNPSLFFGAAVGDLAQVACRIFPVLSQSPAETVQVCNVDEIGFAVARDVNADRMVRNRHAFYAPGSVLPFVLPLMPRLRSVTVIISEDGGGVTIETPSDGPILYPPGTFTWSRQDSTEWLDGLTVVGFVGSSSVIVQWQDR